MDSEICCDAKPNFSSQIDPLICRAQVCGSAETRPEAPSWDMDCQAKRNQGRRKTAEAQRETDTAQKETKEEKEQDLYCSYGMKLLVSID